MTGPIVPCRWNYGGECLTIDEILSRRADEHFCDPADMAATMDEARVALQAMNSERLTRFEIGYLVIVSGEYEAIIESFNDDDTVTVRSEATSRRYNVAKDQIAPQPSEVEPHDFSLCNDAAVFADQAEDFDSYMRQLCADRPDGIIEQYSSATEGHW